MKAIGPAGFRWFPRGAEVKRYDEAALEVGVASYDKAVVAAGNVAVKNEVQVVGYFAKSNKPVFNYLVKGERLEGFLAEQVAKYKSILEGRAARAADRAKKMAEPVDLKVGDVLSSSWGYDQTNVEFWEVLELIGKRSVVIREIAQESIADSQGFMSDRVKPVLGKYVGEPMRKLVGPSGGVKVSNCASAYKCDPNESKYRSWYA